MKHILLRNWEEFRSYIEQNSDNIKRDQLINLLLGITQNIKEEKDVEIRILYTNYLEYFEAISIQEHLYIERPWFNLKDILMFDIVKCKIDSVSRLIVKIRDLLWMLLVFKTDIQCSRCDEDEMRVLSGKDQSSLFLCCDNCGLISTVNGDPISVQEILYPITDQKIKEAGFNPSRDSDE